MKTKPNAPCPCGSGKKAKKCCGLSSTGANLSHLIDEMLSAVNSKDFERAISIYNTAPTSNRGNNTDLLKAFILSSIGIGDFDKAEELSKKFASDASFLFSCGTLCYERKEFLAAINFLKKALILTPRDPNVLMNLAVSYMGLKHYESAIDSLLKLKKLIGQNDSLLVNLGICHSSLSQFEQAKHNLNSVSEEGKQKPTYIAALAGFLCTQNRWDEAILLYEKLEKLFPSHWKFTFEKYKALIQCGKHSDVVKLTKRANDVVRQGSFEAWVSIRRRAFAKTNSLREYLEELSLLHENKPESFFLIQQLIKTYMALADVQNTIKFHEKLHSLNVYDPGYLMWILYTDGLDDDEILKRSKRLYPLMYGAKIEKHKRQFVKGKKNKLRVGYVSADFYAHPVADFFIPSLMYRDSDKYEVFCYSSTYREDATTEKMKALSDQWRSIKSMTALEAKEIINKDCVDVLVDLSGYTKDSISDVFNYRVCPVQVSWIGYPFSSCLENMDYKIVDFKTDPCDLTESQYSEKLYRMPSIFSVYRARKKAEGILLPNYPPCTKKGHLVFGSYNNLAKVTDNALRIWSKILKAVPRSKLFFKAKQFHYQEAKKRVLDIFLAQGISEDRILFCPHLESVRAHYESFADVDINLDTFPYNGTTTTCESLYMGVPVIALKGKSHRSRVSFSQLTEVGLGDLAADSEDEYVGKAIELANDLNRLIKIRSNLRTDMEKSSLMDAKGFAQNLEAAYFDMYNKAIKH